MAARPVNVLALELAVDVGRECKLLYKEMLVEADTLLRNIKNGRHYDARQYADPRGYPEPKGYAGPRHPEAKPYTEHPEARPGKGRGNPNQRADARGRGDPRKHADARQFQEARQHPEPRPHAEPRQHPEHRQHPDNRQQQYVPQQPHAVYEPHRHQAPLAEARNGRHVVQEHAEAPRAKRGHANPANPPQKGMAARNPNAAAAAAAANAALNPAYRPDRVPGNAAPTVNNNAAQPARNHHPVVKEVAGPESDDCVVCWAHEKNVVCIPCGHLAMCKSCSKAVMQQSGLCPVCRQEIGQIVQFFKV